MGSSIDFYRTKIDKEVFAGLRKRSDLRGLVQALSLLVIFIFTNLICLYFFLRSAWILMACSMVVHSLFSNFLGMEASVHELSHRTPFRTRWLNEVFYYLFACITWNNPIHFRESHKLHHQFTLFRGFDREVVIEPAPIGMLDYLSWMTVDWKKIRMIMGANIAFALGRDRPDVFSWDPLLSKGDPKRKKMFFWARFQFLSHLALAAIFIYLDVWVLIYTVSLSYFFFTFLGNACGAMQHIGLSSNVPDFRICCHTMKFGPVMAFSTGT